MGSVASSTMVRSLRRVFDAKSPADRCIVLLSCTASVRCGIQHQGAHAKNAKKKHEPMHLFV